jgi:CRP-like cAMP-binding protein
MAGRLIDCFDPLKITPEKWPESKPPRGPISGLPVDCGRPDGPGSVFAKSGGRTGITAASSDVPSIFTTSRWDGLRLDMSASSIQASGRVPLAGSAATQAPPARTRNKILNLLPPKELDGLLDRSELVTIESEELIFRRKEPIRYAYFPDNCVISLVTEMSDGDSVEAMTVGNDGFVGLAVFHEVTSSWLKAIGQISGETRRVATKDFQELMRTSPALHGLLHRYSQFVFETVSQSAACNRLHVIEQRAARWLLMSEDRVGRTQFDLTQEFLAEMLGVRRPGVTVAMGVLEKAGLIAHGRGNITVLDHAGLEKVACECYGAIRQRQAELFSDA